jgi:Cellulose biosynthesis protein BcsS
MSRVNRIAPATPRLVSAGVAAAFQLLVLQSSAANAADWYTGAAPAKPNDNWIVAVDASASATSTGSQFAAISATIAPLGALNVSGARLRVEGLAGTYLFPSSVPGQQTKGQQVEGGLLGGYEWVTPRSAFAAFGGVSVRDSQFSNNAPGHAANGTMVGFKGVAEYFGRPTDLTMLSAYGSYSTNYNAYYTRFRWGVKPVGQFYVGPEVSALGDDFFREWRFGAHLTGMQIGPFQFGVSGGYLLDKAGKGGGYGTLDARAVY